MTVADLEMKVAKLEAYHENAVLDFESLWTAVDRLREAQLSAARMFGIITGLGVAANLFIVYFTKRG